jgi:hypothetical protein
MELQWKMAGGPFKPSFGLSGIQFLDVSSRESFSFGKRPAAISGALARNGVSF